MNDYVICTKGHDSAVFGAEVPKGSRWFAGDPVVLAVPGNFKKEAN